MKKLIFLLFVSCPLFAAAQDELLYETIEYRTAVTNGTRSRDGNPGINYWQNHADYDISVRLDTLQNRIFGSEEVVYYNNSPDTLYQIVLRLYPNAYKRGAVRNRQVGPQSVNDGVDIDTLLINDSFAIYPGEDNRSVFRGTNLLIGLPEMVPPGGSVKINCNWNYPVPLEPTSFGRVGYKPDSQSWMIGYFYPQVAVYDDVTFTPLKGWDYLLSHMGWQEFYNDFSNFRVRIEVPENFYVWATGNLVNPEEVYSHDFYARVQEARSGDEIVRLVTEADLGSGQLIGNVWQFEANAVPDFAFATSPDFLWDATSAEIDGRRVPVDALYHPDSEFFPLVADAIKKTVEYASNVFPGVPYPWDHASVFNGQTSGGMEFPMIANDMEVPDTLATYYLTFHEVFHNYAPFMLGLNEKRYPYMDEGLTDFTSIQFMEDLYGVMMLEGVWGPGSVIQDYNNYSRMYDTPMNNSYTQAMDYNVSYLYYTKPSVAYTLFLEMVGKERFAEGFREFARRWAGKHPVPYDFFYTMNDVLQENYNWFWDAWFFSNGYPDLAVTLSNGNAVVQRIGRGSLPLPVHLTVQYSDGTEMTVERSMNVWKDGGDSIEIALDNFSQIREVSLDLQYVPDIDPGNNTARLNSAD